MDEMTEMVEKGKADKVLQKRWAQAVEMACKAAKRACKAVYRDVNW